MKRLILLFAVLMLCSGQYYSQDKNMDNPFFTEWKTPFQTPPFDAIKLPHYLPAFEEGIRQQKAEIEAIVNNPEKPTFANTIVALEVSGKFLYRVNRVFSSLTSANTNDDMQKIAETVTSLLSKHTDDIYLNEKLFARIKAVYAQRKKLKLTTEEQIVLKSNYLDFVRGGANLDEAGKNKLRKINDELGQLILKFGDNVRRENAKFELWISDKADLAGLPEASIQAAADKAKDKGQPGKWLLTIDKPTLLPVLTYADNRPLREKMYRAYMNRGNNNDELDNNKVFARMITLRVQKAHLLGYKHYADFVLERKMGKNAEKVFKFLKDMWKPTVHRAKTEVAEMQKIIDRGANKFKLQPWDWWYYAEQVKKEKYNLDEEMTRPYFEVTNVIHGVFLAAEKLYGLQFVERKDIQLYHPEVKVFEVKEADGKHLGILYTDYFPRESKMNGAWCGAFRDQSNVAGQYVTPLIYNVGNFTRPTADKPALLSIDDVTTLFHEFGHALHALLQNVHYPSAANTPSDYVEMPSQIMEKWALQPELLKGYAKHYKTGEPIPENLIEKIKNAKFFNQGFETLEYMAASILDMDYHVITDTTAIDVQKFEKASIKKMGLIPEVWPRYMTTNFIHVASWGYEAGYYSYLWSAVLDADAFSLFMEKGIFDKATAKSFRDNLLSRGGSDDLLKLFKKFRGHEPKVDALLKWRGLE
jgi:peptidyl-dipeptidase Dcp